MTNFWRSNASIVVAALALFAPTHLLAEEDISGVWKGAILSKAGTNNHNLILSFSGSKRRPTGETQYLDLGCQGELKLQSNKRGVYTFKETITAGADKCAGNSTIQVSRASDGTLEFTWLYPNGKIGLQASLVHEARTSASTAIASTTKAPPKEPDWRSSPKSVLQKLDELAGHPLDPTLPPGIEGVFDDELNKLSAEQMVELLNLSSSAVDAIEAQPRHYVAMARLAIATGEEETGISMLQYAAEQHSAVAHALLGDMTEDRDTAIAHYQTAVSGGIIEAQEPLDFYLEQIRTEKAEEQARRLAAEEARRSIFDSFARPDLIKALEQKNTAPFKNIREITYLSNLIQQLEDPSAPYKAPGIELVINRRAGKVLGYKLSTSPQILEQSMEMGMKNLVGMFTGMAETRRRGGTIAEEMTAMTRGMTTVTIGGDVADGEQDGLILLSLFNRDPKTFKKIYAGALSVIDHM